jgi:hypothetical protein
MKLKRDSGNVMWYQTFAKMTMVSSTIEVTDEYHIIGCGWYTTDSSAAVFRLANDGLFQYFYTIAVDSTTSAANKCYGLAYDVSTHLLTMLI